MPTNEIHALYDRHHKVSPSPNPHHKAGNSVKHEDIWKLQLIVCNMKYPKSRLGAFLDISGIITHPYFLHNLSCSIMVCGEVTLVYVCQLHVGMCF